MPIPDFQTLMLPLLKLLSDEKEHSLREIINSLAREFNLSEEERRERLKSGAFKFDNRCHWAKVHMGMARLVETPKRGFAKITARGMEVLKEKPERINIEYLMRFPEFADFRKRKTTGKGDLEKKKKEKPIMDEPPEEVLEKSYQELREKLAQELLEQVKRCSPKFFENLVVGLLVRMGYGGSIKEAGEAIGMSGDEGLDGVIKQDRLGLDNVYIQAKRWGNQAVGRPEIQKFVGALEGRKSKKGVFITTSSFTKEAREYASSVSSRVVLIDGDELAQLMIDHDVGVSPVVSYEIKKIDLDYFEEA